MKQITLSEATNEYLNYIRLEAGQSVSTFINRRARIRHFAGWLDERQGLTDPAVGKITLPILRSFLSYLVDERHLTATTVRGYLESVRGVFAYLQEYGYIEDSPVHRLRMPKRNPPQRELVSNEELLLMFEACSLIRPGRRATMASAVLAVFTYAGLRSKEVRDLRVADVSFDGEDCLLAVRCGKGGKRRVVPMHREGTPYIRSWLEVRGDANTDALFLVDKRRGVGVYALANLFKEVKWLARIDKPGLKPHSLRHNYATRKMADGVNLHQIQVLLGHSNIQTTVNYLHSDLSQLKEAAQTGGLRNTGS